MQRCLRIWLTAVIIVEGACAPKASGPKVETVGDVTFVHNPATPLHPDRTLVFEEELTFGGDDGPEEAILYRPRTILVDESGDAPRRAYDVFNPEGHYIFRIWLGFRPGVFIRGRMYRIHSDQDTGFLMVKRYRVLRARTG